VKKPDIGSKSRFLPTPPAFDAPVRGRSVGLLLCRWHGKTRVVWLPDDEQISKIPLFVLTECTNVTDTRIHRQTPYDSIWPRLCIASRGNYKFCNAVISSKTGNTCIIAARCYASAAYDVMRCLSVCVSVCLSRSCILSKRIKISSKFFHHLVATPFYFFHAKRHSNTPTKTTPTGASNAGGVGINRDLYLDF